MKKCFIVVLVFLLISCASKSDDSTLRVALSQEPPTLDVAANTSLVSRVISSGNIFEKLLTVTETGAIKCELASSYSLSDDNHKLVFVLKDNIFFHNGEKLDSDDVVSSMNRWLRIYKPASDIVQGAEFHKVDNGIEIESSNSLSYLPLLIAAAPQSAAIMPSSIVEALDKNEVVSEYIGTGPFKLKEWKSGESITLERYKEYSTDNDKNKGSIDNIIYFFVSDSVTRALGMKSGLYDFANDAMSEDRALYKDSDISIVEGAESGSIGFIFNKSNGLTANVDFRRALSLSIDNEKVMRACYGDFGWNIHTDYMEREQIFTLSDDNPYKGQNRDRAQEYLKKSGYNGETVRILSSNSSNFDKMAIALADDFEKIGVKTELIILDWAAMMERRKDKSGWDVLISAYTSVPLPQMKLYLSPTYPGWIREEDDGVKLLLEMNDKSLDEAVVLWSAAQSAFWDSVPLVVPGHYITSYAQNKRLHDVIINGGFYFWNARLGDNK